MPNQTEMPAYYEDLNSVQTTWREMLLGAVSERTHPFKKPVLTTIGLNGGPKARIIILRDLDLEGRSIRLHTDARSDKVAEIGKNPNVMLAFYDPAQEIQIQVSGDATVHRHDTYADAAWRGAAPSSRRAYLAEWEPGTPLSGPASGLPADVEGKIPSEERLEQGRSNFAAIRMVFEQVDWLFLSPTGNRRARFVVKSNNWTGTWLAP
ncbi:MAG: pyridoxamine 5'-phosphate oxidase [Parvibaculum sp.]|jgi:general stress protein 26|nr:pyridoxamine 5'-phosphate oxidase [Parvibaculum sp.]|tara:strand:+ start:8112 stop:8735 length:624 start_codon:yes stop_codon:yes gene_type:complete